MSSLSHGDMLRGVAKQILDAQDAKAAAPSSSDSTSAVAEDLSKLPAQQAQTDITDISGPQSPFGIDPGQQSAPAPDPAQTQQSPATQPQQPGAAPSMDFGGQAQQPNQQEGVAPGAPQDPMAFQQQQIIQQEQEQAQKDKDLATQMDIDRAKIENQGDETRQQYAQARHEEHAGRDLRLQAQADKNAVNQQIAAAQAPINAEQIEFMKHQALAEQQLNDWHAARLQDTISKQNDYRDQMLQMANEHPEDVWGNASIGGKIAGIIGIIGAGFAHADTTQIVHQAVQSAVAAQMRKAKFLEEANNQTTNIAATGEKLFQSKDAALSAMTANQYKIFAARLSQAAARYNNPIAQANLLDAKGLALQQSAKFDAETTDKEMEHLYKGLDLQVKLDEHRLTNQAAMKNGLSQSQQMIEGKIPGWDGYFTKEQKAKFAPIAGAGHSLIASVDRARELAHKLQSASGSHNLDTLIHQYDAACEQAFIAFRNYSASGANIQGLEASTFKGFFPSQRWIRTVGRIDGSFSGIDEARDSIVQNLKFNGEAQGIGTARFNPSFPLYAPSVQRWQDQADEPAKTAQQARVDAKDKANADAYNSQQKEKIKQERSVANAARGSSYNSGSF